MRLAGSLGVCELGGSACSVAGGRQEMLPTIGSKGGGFMRFTNIALNIVYLLPFFDAAFIVAFFCVKGAPTSQEHLEVAVSRSPTPVPRYTDLSSPRVYSLEGQGVEDRSAKT